MTNRDEQQREARLARLEREDAARVVVYGPPPHTKLTFEFTAPVRFNSAASNILSRITDGVSDAIKIILAQHGLQPLPNGRVTIEAVPPKQKEVTNGE